MMQRCVHKGCGKQFSDPNDECVYHPGPPVFHEGQKGWNCCKPRVLTFDEFLSIAPCTTGKHSAVSKPPAVVTQPTATEPEPVRIPAVQEELSTKSHPTHQRVPPAPAVEPESDSDDPSFSIPPNTACRRRGCGAYSSPTTASSREEEKCIYHPGHPIFHEGTKGWTCCKKRVLEFDEFMRIEGCSEKSRHMYVGSGKKNEAGSTGEKNLETVRHDYYQTDTAVHASLYLKRIRKEAASVVFSSPKTIDLDLPTADNTRYKASFPLYGSIDPTTSSFKILGTKLDLDLIKDGGSSWPALRADDTRTGGIIQTGKAGRA